MAEVIQLPAAAPEPAVQPVPRKPDLRPIVPDALRRANLRSTAGQVIKLHWHRARYHGFRIPHYTLMTVFFAFLGTGRLAATWYRWVSWPEGKQLESVAVAAGRAGHAEAMRAHTVGKETRAARWWITAASAAAVLLTAGAAVAYVPPVALVPLAVAGLVVLGRHGRKAGQPLVQAAVVSPQVEKLTPDVVLRALKVLSIAGISQAIGNQEWGLKDMLTDPIHRDGPGWLANVSLPFGVTATEIMDRREKLASGLRRPLGCVWPETVPGGHPGQVALWVGYEDMSKTRQAAWPLARAGTADLFRPVQFGTDQRGRGADVTLMFTSGIVGSIPRMGKTFLLRLLLLIAALDPRAEVHAYDLKGTGDLSPLERVAHRYRPGDEDEDIDYAIADLRRMREEMRRRTKVIRGLPKEICPENKVTPDLAKDRRLRLHPVVIGVDECQVWFEHPVYGKEFESICTDLVKRGPALGIVILLATQRPDAKSIPTGISANAVLRWCLKVMGWQENDMVLGTGAHSRGTRATMFDLADKGICYFSGEGERPRIVRTHEINQETADVIALRARGLRERAGTLSGYALGVDGEEEVRSFPADVLSVFGDDTKLWSETVAARLRGQLPGAYEGITPEAVASQLRQAQIPVKDVREAGKANRKGCEREAVEAAAGVREDAGV